MLSPEKAAAREKAIISRERDGIMATTIPWQEEEAIISREREEIMANSQLREDSGPSKSHNNGQLACFCCHYLDHKPDKQRSPAIIGARMT
ncbi:MAG: hypothetical protein IJL78_09725 [Lachnospiraceae bacterium]|nr:hypothetical protein [Lachnospiraceae bacterium]